MKKKLSLFFAGVAFCLYTQQAYGMHFAKAAVRGLWNNKITLTGAGFVANGFSEYADSWNDNYERIKLVSFYGAAETPWIPIQEKMKIEKAFQDRGLKVTLITMEENTPRPAIGVSVIGDHACFFLNPVAIQAFWNEKDNVYFPRVEYTADEMRTAFHHELVHVDERDNEKVLAVKASLPTVNFCAAASVYKGMCAALPKYSGGKKALIQTCAVGTGLLTYYVAKATNFLVKNAYSRRVERIADEGVINTHDEKTINIRKKYFQKMHMSEQVQKCFDPTFVPETDLPLLLRTYPTYGERIARCDEALAQLEAAKK